ncbi:MAG TPA: hypothetical protein VH575_36245, partial [Gemmataceae bacterium]
RGMAAPDVLLSGDHGAVARWRQEQSLARSRRPRDEDKKTSTTKGGGNHEESTDRSGGGSLG